MHIFIAAVLALLAIIYGGAALLGVFIAWVFLPAWAKFNFVAQDEKEIILKATRISEKDQ